MEYAGLLKEWDVADLLPGAAAAAQHGARGPALAGLAAEPGSDALWTLERRSGRLLRVTVSSGEACSFPLEDPPPSHDMAVDGSGRVYLASGAATAVRVFDPHSGVCTGLLDAGVYPVRMSACPGGGLAVSAAFR